MDSRNHIKIRLYLNKHFCISAQKVSIPQRYRAHGINEKRRKHEFFSLLINNRPSVCEHKSDAYL